MEAAKHMKGVDSTVSHQFPLLVFLVPASVFECANQKFRKKKYRISIEIMFNIC